MGGEPTASIFPGTGATQGQYFSRLHRLEICEEGASGKLPDFIFFLVKNGQKR